MSKQHLKDYTTIQVHPGKFHADDVMCVVLAKMVNPAIKVVRGGEPMVDDEEVIVADYGHGEFDHHDIDDTKVRENGIKYSACGLIVRAYGEEIFSSDYVRERIDKEVIMGVDAVDNGCEIPEENLGTALCEIIKNFNVLWDEDRDDMEAFEEACDIAYKIVSKKIASFEGKERALDIVKNAYNDAKDKRIISFDRFVPAKDFFAGNTEDVIFFVYPSQRGGYNIQAVPPNMTDWLEQRCTIPESLINMEGVTFIHPTGFLAATTTQQQAIELGLESIRIANESGTNSTCSNA